MDMNLLKYMAFIKTVECGSFTRAAEALSYSQSGISRMVSDLEAEWKVSLLTRSRAGVLLTSDGIKLLAYAKKLCEDYDQLQAQVDALSGLQSGILRIGAFSSAAALWLPGSIRTFQTLYPKIDFEILTGDDDDVEEWICEGRVDFGFLQLPARAELETEFIEQDPLLAVLAQAHPLAACKKVSLADLCGEPFILLERRRKNDVAELFERCGLTPDVRITTPDDDTILSMVESGIGISVLPQMRLKRCPYRVAARELDVPAYRNIGLAMRDKRAASHAVKVFLTHFQARTR